MFEYSRKTYVACWKLILVLICCTTKSAAQYYRCLSPDNNCDPASSNCVANDGMIECVCIAGYTGGGRNQNCIDIDECTTGSHNCAAPNLICVNAVGSYSCSCRQDFVGDGSNCTPPCGRGFNYSRTLDSCVDTNECEARSSPVCQNIGEVCRNFEGGFSCDCAKGFAEVYDSGGRVSCRFITSMTQRFGIPYFTQLNDSNSAEFGNLSSKLEQTIFEMYGAGGSVTSVVIKRFTPGPSVTAWYEVSSSTGVAVTPNRLRQMYERNTTSGFWQQRLGNVSVDYPEAAPLLCMASKIRSKRVGEINWIWTFGETRAYSWKQSDVNCKTSSLGYVASVECTTRTNEDGTVSAFYETTTLYETSCVQFYSSLIPQVTGGNVTTETVEAKMALISAYATTFTADSLEDMTSCVIIMHDMATQIELNSVKVSEMTMNFLVWTENSLHEAVKESLGSNITSLSDVEKINLIRTLEVFAALVDLKHPKIRLETRTSVFEAKPVIAASSIAFSEANPDEAIIPSFITFGVEAVVPPSAWLFSDGSDFATNALFYLHEDAILFPSPEEANAEVVGKVLSIQISNTNMTNLKEPITQLFPRSSLPVQFSKVEGCDIRWERCGYFSIPDGKWKYDGCVTNVSSVGRSTTCNCNHATNFAVIVQTQHVMTSFALNVIGMIGCACSIVGIVLLLIIYASFRSLRTEKINQVHMHLCGCLLVAYITFLIAVERPRAYTPCMIVGIILQLAFLAAWGWMVVEFVVMYKKFIRIFGELGDNFLTKASLLVYSLSTLTTAITFTVAYTMESTTGASEWLLSPTNDPLCWTSYYVSDRLCWLHSKSLYFGFLTPVGVMCCINFAGYVILLRKITRPRTDLGQITKRSPELKQHAIRIFTLSVLLGAAWVFAVPLTLSENAVVNEVFSWLFSLTNSFQGVCIFVLFCVKRQDVRNLWVNAITSFFKRGKSRPVTNEMTSTPRTEGSNGILSNAGSNNDKYTETAGTMG